ncbi:CdaR family protein [Paenibacillus guangzhouensis]|uniref:hypothetical protein n=1 Tax=Paenibacillus guangzhouensis TaxID=1473112 RepID=UPI001266EDCF|nr:hypothetical protein [Paenibacillus guangzhouensis]
MYRLFIVSDEPEEYDRLEELITRCLPGIFQLFHIESEEMMKRYIEQKGADVLIFGCSDTIRSYTVRQLHPRCRIVYVIPGDPCSNEDLLMALRRQVQELDLGQMKRIAHRIELNKTKSIIPMTENLLAILLMMESIPDAKFQQLTDILGLPWHTGYAMMIAFPQIEGISPTENHMRLTRYYDAVNHFTKQLGPCVTSPMMNRYMTVFFVVEDDWDVLGKAALLRAERLYKLLDYVFGTNITLGIGTVKPVLELRQSYRQAAISAAYGEAHAIPMATIEDVQRSAARRNTAWLKRDTSIEFQLRPELGTMAYELEQQHNEALMKLMGERGPSADSIQFG